MRAVVQRVKHTSLSVNGELISDDDEENCSIEDGLESLFCDQLQYDFLEGYLNTTPDSVPQYNVALSVMATAIRNTHTCESLRLIVPLSF